MSATALVALIDVARPAGWLAALVIVLWLIGLMMRYLDRLANAVNLWKLAEDRQAARKAALTATKAADRRQALAVLDSLQRQPSPERTSLDRRRTKPTR